MEKRKGTERAPVPAHVFEAMLRGTLGNEEGGIAIWKETLLHWYFTSAQLDQLTTELKKGDISADKGGLEFSADILEFIDSKIRD